MERRREVLLNLDGVLYSSADPGLSPELRRLLDRVRDEGMTPRLCAEWREGRLKAGPSAPAPVWPSDRRPARDARVLLCLAAGSGLLLWASQGSSLAGAAAIAGGAATIGVFTLLSKFA